MKNSLSEEIDFLFSPETIRLASQKMFEHLKSGHTHFKYHPQKWDSTVELVYKSTKERFPDLEIPFHSRWRHFDIGKPRLGDFKNKLSSDPEHKLCSLLDLCFVSVLLDAGAGESWSYSYKNENERYGRSEGLALASLGMFEDGVFGSKHTVDAKKLANLSLKDLSEGLQVTKENSLVGVEGRLNLLHQFGEVILSNPNYFPNSRPSGFYLFLKEKFGQSLEAKDFLKELLYALKDIWPQGDTFKNNKLGDVWYYPPFGKENEINSYVPFHKLPQWLSYSILELLIDFNMEVKGVNSLTGLAEYRNGGLFLDSGVLELRDPNDLSKTWKVNSELIIEWRALTLNLLDKLHEDLRSRFNKTNENYPLVKTLEGGSWKVGRELAYSLRGGSSPLMIERDGTVF